MNLGQFFSSIDMVDFLFMVVGICMYLDLRSQITRKM